MVIKQIYSPLVAGEVSGEALIFKRGLGNFLDEIRQSVLQNTLLISPKKTVTKKGGQTGNIALAAQMNKAIGASLKSLGWGPRKAPGASGFTATLDWYKAAHSGLSYGPANLGLGLEVQFGNNFQFEADLKRLSEAIIANEIVAGVCIVVSDELAKYKADRGAHFSSEKSKMDRFLSILHGSGAATLPGFLLIGVSQDGFTENLEGLFKLEAPIYDNLKGVRGGPIKYESFGNLKA